MHFSSLYWVLLGHNSNSLIYYSLVAVLCNMTSMHIFQDFVQYKCIFVPLYGEWVSRWTLNKTFFKSVFLSLQYIFIYPPCTYSATPQFHFGLATHLSVQFNCLVFHRKKKQKKTVAIRQVIYIFLVCVFFLSPSSDFSGRLKLLYYSPRVCQIPEQLQTHHPSPVLCLRGNKVLGFPGWQICVIVLCPGWWEQLRGCMKRKRRGGKEGKRQAMKEGGRSVCLFKWKLSFFEGELLR